MPRPVYILCAAGATEDKDTGLLSLMEIMEKINVAPLPQPKPGEVTIAVWHPMRVYSVWMKEDQDGPESEYEHELRMLGPLEGKEVNLGGGRFRFAEYTQKPFYRFVARFEKPLPLEGVGIMKFEHRIRIVGTENWISQDVPLVVEQVTQEQLQQMVENPGGN